MAGKLGHGKGKHHPQSKKGKAKQRQTAFAVRPQVAAPVIPAQEQAAPAVPAPPTRARAKSVQPIQTQYSNVTSELKRIGILSGIILAILVILALVLQ